jgi:hypothetical protein
MLGHVLRRCNFSRRKVPLLMSLCALCVFAVNIYAFEASPESPSPAGLAPMVITLDKSSREKGGIATAEIAQASHEREAHAYGTVLSLKSLAELGGRWAQARARVENAEARLDASRAEYSRQKALYSQKESSSLKAFQAAESTWRENRSNLRAARDSQAAMEGAARQEWGDVITGWVLANDPQYSRLLSREFLIQVTVSPNEEMTSMPREITIQTPGRNRLKGGLISPAPRTAPEIQGLSYFYSVPARGAQLRADMNVTAFLSVGPPLKGFLIPEGAVVWENGAPIVFVRTGADQFTARPVSTETATVGGYFVTSGFTAGESVVVRGAQALLSEFLLSSSGQMRGGAKKDDD